MPIRVPRPTMSVDETMPSDRAWAKTVRMEAVIPVNSAVDTCLMVCVRRTLVLYETVRDHCNAHYRPWVP